MNKKFWISAWIVLYVATVAMGVFLPGTLLAGAMGVLFFVPPAVLLYTGIREKNKRLVFWVRTISIASLALTTVTLVSIMLSLLLKGDQAFLDKLLEAILILVSAPMMCFDAIAVSLFGWAILLSASFIRQKS